MATCDMSYQCQGSVEYVSLSGFVYCAQHGAQHKRFGFRARKMSGWERRWIAAGKPLPSYTPGPEPKEA